MRPWGVVPGFALVALALATRPGAGQPAPQPGPARGGGPEGELFQTSHTCAACHNGLVSPDGEDVSIGLQWRGSVMANSSRDPYWQASVRRETTDHPLAQAHIEDECSICHMPMATFAARARGAKGRAFTRFPPLHRREPADLLAADGVSCTLCHQIEARNLGTPRSFTGGYVIEAGGRSDSRPAYGPYTVDPGRVRIMSSAAGFTPFQAAQVRQSELCATCHTLFTDALGPDGRQIGGLPEQVPFLEWLHGDFKGERTCQACHMRVVEGPAAIAAVLGEPRPELARHEFRGANFLLSRLLNLHRVELAVEALPDELEGAALRATELLQKEAVTLGFEQVAVRAGRITATVRLETLAGHKVPTAYPSRRAWLHVVARDRDGRAIFDSGALAPDGSVRGNDNDADRLRFEPHHLEVRSADQVQVYESVMVDAAGQVTTGLLSAVRYVKDNRLLPRGFEKTTAPPEIAVVGEAARDPDFAAGGDRVGYSMETGTARGPFTVDAELLYQPIGFRWAHNLAAYDADEAVRFVRYYDGLARGSAVVLARASARTD